VVPEKHLQHENARVLDGHRRDQDVGNDRHSTSLAPIPTPCSLRDAAHQ
jgi:hypothetical protein